MKEDMSEYSLLLARIERLESRNRLLARGGAFCLVVLGSLFWMGQTRPIKVLDAQKFMLRDLNGKRQAEFGIVDGSPSLIFLDGFGRTAMSVGMEAGQPGLTMYGNSAEKILSISRLAVGPTLTLYDERGAKRLNLSVGANGPAIGLLGRGGEARSALGMTSKEEAFLQLFAQREHGGIQILAAPERSVLRILDDKDTPRTVLGLLEKEGTPGLVLNQGDGSPRVLLMLSGNGPGLDFLSSDKTVLWKAP